MGTKGIHTSPSNFIVESIVIQPLITIILFGVHQVRKIIQLVTLHLVGSFKNMAQVCQDEIGYIC